MGKKKFNASGKKPTPNSRGVRRSTRIAMTLFLIVALACEILLISGFRKDPHPLMYGIVIGVITMVFVGIGAGIRYIGKLAALDQKEAEDRNAEGRNTDVNVAPNAEVKTLSKEEQFLENESTPDAEAPSGEPNQEKESGETGN